MTLLTIAEAAPLLRHSVSGVRKMLRSRDARKRPPALRISGRILFDQDQLDAWIRAQAIDTPRLRKRPSECSASIVRARLEAIADGARA